MLRSNLVPPGLCGGMIGSGCWYFSSSCCVLSIRLYTNRVSNIYITFSSSDIFTHLCLTEIANVFVIVKLLSNVDGFFTPDFSPVDP
jgi:hypothetical protein